MTTAASLNLLWANCVERLKDRINNRSVWEALEKTQPIVIEEDTLIVGMDSLNFNLVSHILQTQTLNTVTNTVEEYFGRRLKLRIIEGTTLAEWEATKQREQQAAAAIREREAGATRQGEDKSRDSWEELYDHVARLYAQTPYRSLPQGKARYACEALYTLVEAMDTLYQEPADESTERNLARTLDRIANAAEIPATVLAFELDRLRAWRRGNAEPSSA